MTSKQLANRMKAKGLQRLRWYCQMCEKQCRDENGFKCHCLSESHLRQMALFSSSTSAFIDTFSQQLVDGYLAELRRKGGRTVNANHVYTAYIADREHVHMNATKWDSLSSFVGYLGKSGLVEASQDEDGHLLVRYIDRDPRVLQRQEELAKKEGRERSAEEEERRRIDAEIAEARRRREDGHDEREEEDEVEARRVREEEEAERLRAWRAEGDGQRRGLSLSLQPQSHATAGRAGQQPPEAAPARMGRPSPLLLLAGAREKVVSRRDKRPAAAMAPPSTSSTSTLQLLMDEEEQRKAKQRRITDSASAPQQPHNDDGHRLLPPQLPPPSSSPRLSSFSASSFAASASWLCPSLVVRVLSRSLLGGAVYRHKAAVLAVSADGGVATLSMLSSAQSPSSPPSPALIVDCPRHELESVIPALGQPVLLVRGVRKGCRATLLRLSDDQSSCSVRVEGQGELLDGVALDAVCKLSTHSPP